jgi:hypothetical protein
MGTPSNSSTPTGQEGASNNAQHSFGDNLLAALSKRYPIAGAVGQAAFGDNAPAGPTGSPGVTSPSVIGDGSPPLIQMQPLPDMIGMNAQPKKSGFGEMLAKLLIA